MPEGYNDRVKYDDRTSRGWPLPHWLNKLAPDSRRLRETLRTIDADICEIEGSASDSSERLDSVETRLDVIAGQTTEDTEILDARVDAENQTHPNLGHNLRYIHSLLLQADEAIRYQAQEFQGLLQQYDDLARAQIKGEVNAQEAHERRKDEIRREILNRRDNDSVLQGQIDILADTNIQDALSRKKDHETFRAKIETEAQERINADEKIHGELIAQHEKISQAQNDIAINRDNIQQEASARVEDDKYLQGEIDTLGQAQLQHELNDRQAHERRKDEIRREISNRRENDSVLQGEIDTLSDTQIKQALSIQEINQRRKNTEEKIRSDVNAESRKREYEISQLRLETQTDASNERFTRISQDDGLQEQINLLALAVIRQTVSTNEAKTTLLSRLNEILQKFNEIYDALVDAGAITYKGAKVATSNEITDMLSDVMSGSDEGAVRISQIPDELKDEIAISEEVSEMLGDLGFPLPN